MIRLKELRDERGWNMKEAAEFLGQKYTTYVNHEKGYREPNSEDLTQYAKLYNVSIDYLVGRTDMKNPVTKNDGSVENYSISDKDRQFLSWFRSLSPEKQRAILVSQDAPEDIL